MEILDQCRRLEVREKARNVFSDEPTSVYETGYSQLGATRLVGYLPSHIQRALME